MNERSCGGLLSLLCSLMLLPSRSGGDLAFAAVAQVPAIGEVRETVPAPAKAPPANASGPLEGLAMLVMSSGEPVTLNATISDWLWPVPGGQKYVAKKIRRPEGLNLKVCYVRTDQQDIVLLHRQDTMTGADTKHREDHYFRTTAEGDLRLATYLSADLTVNGNTENPSALTHAIYQGSDITADMQAEFEADKADWLAAEPGLTAQVVRQSAP